MTESSDISGRIHFLQDHEIMEVDFSDYTFEDSGQVNQVYDRIEEMIAQTNRKWYFMVNYRNTRINPDAWFQYARRGKELNIASSLGSVRFDPAEPTRQEIMQRAQSEDFNPNLVSSREEAMDRIAELKQEAVT